MIDTVPRPDANLLELLAARARHASDGRLVANAVAGMAAVTAAIVIRAFAGPAWELLLALGIVLFSYAAWGIADRELAERGHSAPRVAAALWAVRWVAAVAGLASAAFVALALMGRALGTIIS